MPSATAVSVVYAVISVVVAGLWVLGYLDKYQRMAQDAALGSMGDNRVSFGVKSAINQDISGDKDVKEAQGKAADAATSQLGKGGAGQGVGDTLSKGL